MQKGSKVALFLAFVFATQLVFSQQHKPLVFTSLHPHQLMSGKPARHEAATRQHWVIRRRQRRVLKHDKAIKHMANIQIAVGAGPVNVPFTTTGAGPGTSQPTVVNNLQIVTSTGALIGASTPAPAAGASITLGTFTVTNTGQTSTIPPGSYTNPVFSVTANTGTALGVGYALELLMGNSTNAYGLFDIVTAPTAPPAPTFGTPTASSVPVNIPALTANATSYNLQRATVTGGTLGAFATVTGGTGVPPSTVFADATVASGTTYAYQLVAVGSGGTTTGPSAQVSTPIPAPTAPAAPTFGTPTPTRIPVIIPALAGGATSYDLYRAPAIAGSPGTFAADALAVTPAATFSDTVSPSAGYFYRLTANNAVGSTVGAVSALITSGVLIVPGTNLKRSAILEQLRYGVHDATTQATLAQGVNATNRLLSLTLAPTPVEPMDDVDASGFKVAVGTQSHQGKHTTLAVSGTMAYFDTIVALDMCLCKAVVTTPGTGGAAAVKTKRYAFRPSPSTADEVDVTTLDWGYGLGAAARAARAALASFSLTFARDKPVFGGSGFAQRLAENGVALAADTAVNDVPLVVVDGDDWSAYIADTLAGFVDAAKLTDCYETSIAMNNRFAPVFVGDSTQPSYNGFAEQKNDILGAINIQQDAFGQQQVMGALRAKAQKWCRIVACGPDIETVGGVTYRNRIQITYPLNFRNPRRANTENVTAGQYDLKAIYDSASRSFLEILVDVDGTLAPNLLAAGTPLIAAQQPTALIPLESCGVSA